MTRSKRYPWTYQQEIAQLKRRNKELRDALAGVRAATRGMQVPVPSPEREDARQKLEEREQRLRALETEAIWKP
jgi:predicted  nucleic acid-binding Zn-ribbon protein